MTKLRRVKQRFRLHFPCVQPAFHLFIGGIPDLQTDIGVFLPARRTVDGGSFEYKTRKLVRGVAPLEIFIYILGLNRTVSAV